MNKSAWLIVYAVIFIKACMYIQRLMRPIPNITPVQVKEGLGRVRNENSTYNILNKKNVRFRLSPEECFTSDWMMIMISSGPKNGKLRNEWRKRMENRSGIKVVFLVANAKTDLDQNNLENEHEKNGDIVQCDVEDGHRLLGYKILCGHVWSYEHCRNVKHVAKSDDNVHIDMDKLTHVLSTDTSTDWKNLITCPTECFGMKTIRSNSAQMTGNWSHSKEEWSRDFMPDFCVGFLSLTTPDVGAQLAQVGLELYGDSETPIAQIEDSLITGVLRERLPHVRIEMMHLGYRWERFFTWCGWLHMFKQTFFNDLIISKTSSRKNVQYVGSVTNPKVWKFFICVMVEGCLGWFETNFPTLVPSFLWNICSR